MKKVIGCILFCFIVSTLPVRLNAQNNDSDAIAMLRKFYIVYNTAWSTTKGKVLIKKLDSLQAIYCTKKLHAELKDQGLDHDPLIGDDFTDVQHLNTLKIIKDFQSLNNYSISYTVHGMAADYSKKIDRTITVHVTVVVENKALKIASAQ